MPKGQNDGRIRYLVSIYEISRQKGRVRSVEIARSLDISRASVHNMLQTLSMEGLIDKRYYGDVVLTEAGYQEAMRRYEQYQCICAMFTDCLQMPLAEAKKAALVFLTAQAEETAERVVQIFAKQTGTMRANS